MTKDNREGFTLGLALTDAVPVLLFSATIGVISAIFRSPIFLMFIGFPPYSLFRFFYCICLDLENEERIRSHVSDLRVPVAKIRMDVEDVV